MYEYNCVPLHLTQWRSLQLRGIPTYTTKNSTVAWHSASHTAEIYHCVAFHLTHWKIVQSRVLQITHLHFFKFRSISTNILKKYTLAWQSTLHIKKLHSCVAFHLAYCGNCSWVTLYLNHRKKITCSWYYRLNNEQIQLRGIPNYTLKNSACS
jgi:hypothetical protein